MAAGDAVVKGSTDFTEQPCRMVWKRGKGWTVVRIFQGPFDNTKILAKCEELQAAKYTDISITKGHPTTIEASTCSTSNDAISEDPENVGIGVQDESSSDVSEWSLDPYNLDKELGTHGVFNLSTDSPNVLALIDKDVRSGESYGKDYDTLYSGLGSLNAYAKLLGQGTTSYQTFGFVLRRVLTVDVENIAVQQFQQNLTNHGKIITWGDIQVPDVADIDQPWVHMYVSPIWTTLSIKPGSAASGWTDVLIDEWLVKPAAIRFTNDGRTRKRQLVQEFIGAVAWSATLYDGGKGVP